MKKNDNNLANALSWVVTITTPFILLMIAIRLLITPLTAQAAYRLPNFPDDPFGFSQEDRLKWSAPSIRYLVNSDGIEYLESLKFDNGDNIFNERELSHMQDVKSVITGMRIALSSGMIVLLIITVTAVRGGWKPMLFLAFRRGGWALIGLITAILAFVILNFNNLFTWFHQLFFESGTWLFYTSDTLIRLFPMRFWRDAFITVGLLCLIMATLLIQFSRSQKN